MWENEYKYILVMNQAQNKIVHSLLDKLGLMPQKAAIVSSFTNGRTDSSRQMSHIEALDFIKWLQEQDKGNKKTEAEQANQMRRKILAKAHRLNWELPNGKVDMQRINGWCLEKSYLKKSFNSYTYKELPELVSQFNKVYEYYINKVSA